MKHKIILTRLKNKFSTLPIGQTKFCCMCNCKVGDFLPYDGGWNSAPPLMKALDIIGSDLDNFACPKCGSHDRERHLLLYFEKQGCLKAMAGASILHFAPERWLSKVILGAHPLKYVKADLFPVSADIEKIDMLAIPYAEGTFDWVIANHVLEHVPDEIKALTEIHRVLRPGGYAVLQTPYCNMLNKTFLDDGIHDPEARLQAYGQSDHVRLFGRDIYEKITDAGFKSCVVTHEQVLTDVNAKYFGVNEHELFMLFRKI